MSTKEIIKQLEKDNKNEIKAHPELAPVKRAVDNYLKKAADVNVNLKNYKKVFREDTQFNLLLKIFATIKNKDLKMTIAKIDKMSDIALDMLLELLKQKEK